jgi:hypothetical protein
VPPGPESGKYIWKGAPRAQAQRGQSRRAGALGTGLAGQRLPRQRDAGQTGQRGQHPPADRLRMDRGGNRGGGPVEVLAADPLGFNRVTAAWNAAKPVRPFRSRTL